MIKYFLLLFFCSFAVQVFAQHKDIPNTSEFTVTGAVKKEMKFNISDIAGMKQEMLGDVVTHSHRTDTVRQMKGILLKTIVDSAGIVADNPKAYNDIIIELIGADGYKNVYSWNELFNTDIGNHVYLVTGGDGKTLNQMTDRIAVLSLADIFTGRRHMKGLARIEVKHVQ